MRASKAHSSLAAAYPGLAVVATIAGVCGASCVPPAVSAWNPSLSSAECEVTIRSVDGMGELTSLERYDADGRLIARSYHPEYDSSAWVNYRYELAPAGTTRIEFAYQRRARQFPCETLKGCDEPEVRTLGNVEVRHDQAGRVVRIRERRTEYAVEGGRVRRRFFRWNRDHDAFYAYDAQGHLIEVRSERGKSRYIYDSNRLVRAIYKGDGVTEEVFEYDAGGRRVRMLRKSCGRLCSDFKLLEEHEYDDANRLVRVSYLDRSPPRREEWTYDSRGLVVRWHRTSAEQEDSYAYSLDELGRLAEKERADLVVRESRSYSGRCARLPRFVEPRASRIERSGQVDDRSAEPVFP